MKIFRSSARFLFLIEFAKLIRMWITILFNFAAKFFLLIAGVPDSTILVVLQVTLEHTEARMRFEDHRRTSWNFEEEIFRNILRYRLKWWCVSEFKLALKIATFCESKRFSGAPEKRVCSICSFPSFQVNFQLKAKSWTHPGWCRCTDRTLSFRISMTGRRTHRWCEYTVLGWCFAGWIWRCPVCRRPCWWKVWKMKTISKCTEESAFGGNSWILTDQR